MILIDDHIRVLVFWTKNWENSYLDRNYNTIISEKVRRTTRRPHSPARCPFSYLFHSLLLVQKTGVLARKLDWIVKSLQLPG